MVEGKGSRIGVDISVGVGFGASTVEGKGGEGVATDALVLGQDSVVARGGEGAEPGGVTGRRGRVAACVGVGGRGVALGRRGSRDEGALLRGAAADVLRTLRNGCGANGSEFASDLGSVCLGVGVDGGDGVVVVDNQESVVGVDVIGTSTGMREVVCMANWKTDCGVNYGMPLPAR